MDKPDAPPAQTHDLAAVRDLLDVMARLRDPARGCPWDLAQDFASIAPFTVEEAYEVADAISDGPDPARLLDELGDLLLQAVYHARLAEERGWFGFAAVARHIADKMVRRHPHVFGSETSAGAAAQELAWELQKQDERNRRAETGTLAGVAAGLPALTRAAKLTRRAARVGFDWPDAGAVLEKLAEEAGELRAELPAADRVRLEDELGDLLFVAANLARKLDLDPEAALAAANRKFERRFAAVEARLAADGIAPADAGIDRMEADWAAVKKSERAG
jgi:ATP diphosphatase